MAHSGHPDFYFLPIIYFSGQPIPRVDYTPEEVTTWKEVYLKVVDLLPGRACTTHRKALEAMMKECNFSEDIIPQMEDVSNYLKSKISPSISGQHLKVLFFSRKFWFFIETRRRLGDST